MYFLDMLTTGPKTDIPRTEPHDLFADEFLSELMSERRARTSTPFPRLYGGPARGREVTRQYASSERRRRRARPAVEQDSPEGDETDAFARLLTDSPDQQPLPDMFGTGKMSQLFEPIEPIVPISKASYGPLKRATRQSIGGISRTGYNEPITDPYGDLMRNALRRLVRAS